MANCIPLHSFVPNKTSHVLVFQIIYSQWDNILHACRCTQENIALIDKALHGDFVIPEFGKFSGHIQNIYQKCKDNSDGKVGLLPWDGGGVYIHVLNKILCSWPIRLEESTPFKSKQC